MDPFNFDLTTQQEQLERRRKVIEAMEAGQQLAPGQGSSGAAMNSILNAINKYKAGDMRQQLDADTASLRSRYNEQLGKEGNAFLDLSNGAPARMPGGDGVGPPTPPVVANPREAVIRAMTSQLPEMQAMGKAAFSSLSKPAASEKFGHDPKTVEGPDGKPVLIVMGDQGTVKEVKGYGPNSNEWSPLQVLGQGPDGKPVMGWVNKRTNEPKPLNAGQTINVDTKGTTELQKEVLPVLKESRESAIRAQDNLQAAERVMKLVDDPNVITGFGASAVTGLGALSTALGFTGPEGVAKTQALATEMAAKTLSNTKQLTGAISDKEKPFLEQVVAGKIDFTPQVIKHVAALTIQANHNIIMNSTDQYHGALKVPGMAGAENLYPLPELKWNVPQGKAFKPSNGGRIEYDGSFLSGPTPGQVSQPQPQRRTMTMQEFLEGSQ